MNRSHLANGCVLAMLLSLVVVAFPLTWSGTPRLRLTNFWYSLTVENHGKEAVVVLVDGSSPRLEDVVVEGCSSKRIDYIWFRPGQVVDVDIRDIHGKTILTVEASPEVREGSSADWYLEVVVPGATDDECPG